MYAVKDVMMNLPNRADESISRLYSEQAEEKKINEEIFRWQAYFKEIQNEAKKTHDTANALLAQFYRKKESNYWKLNRST